MTRLNFSGVPNSRNPSDPLGLGDILNSPALQPKKATPATQQRQHVYTGLGNAATFIRDIPAQGPTPPSFMEQAGAFALGDVYGTEQIERMNREQNAATIAGLEGRIGDVTSQRLGGIREADSLLAGDVTRLREQGGDDLATFDRNAADAISTADSYSMAAVKAGEDAVASLEDRRAQDMAAALLSMKSQMRDEEAMSTLNPDGSMKTPAQIESEKMQRREYYHNQIASVQTQIASQYNTTLAGLKTTLANINLNAGSLAAGTRTNLATGRLQAEAGRRDYETLSAGLNQARAQLKTAALGSALMDDLNGRTATAQFKFSNPYSYVSKFSAFAQLAALGTSPGISRVSPINLGTTGGPVTAGPTVAYRQRTS